VGRLGWDYVGMKGELFLHVDGGCGVVLWRKVGSNLVHGDGCCVCFLFLHQRLQGCSINSSSRWTILHNSPLVLIVGGRVYTTIISCTKAAVGSEVLLTTLQGGHS